MMLQQKNDINYINIIAKQLLSNLENVNLLSNPKVNPKNGVAYKKNV